jgi:prepilin-type N-terminal cleavage/methylation domain-containing protein
MIFAYSLILLRGSPSAYGDCIMQMTRKKRPSSHDRQHGFTLMELCVVVAIICVIAAISIPNLLGMRARYKLRSSATDILSTIKKAQTEAVKRALPVAVAINTGTGTCTVFVDDGAGGGGAKNLVRDGTEQQLFITTLSSGNSLTNNTFPAGGNNNIEFESNGRPVTIGGVPIVGSLDVVDSAGLAVQYQVTVSITGQVKLVVL